MKIITVWVCMAVLALAGPADLSQCSWLAGRWVGDEGGAVSEEIWSPPAGDSMMGVWRLVLGGKTKIFEFCAITARDEGLVLMLHHFDSNGVLRASEKEKPIRGTLVSSKAGEMVFEGQESSGPFRLTYRKTGDDAIVIILEKGTSKQEFHFRRA